MAKISTLKKASSTLSRKAESGRSLSAGQQTEVARLAYQFFIERGGQHGHDREDWLRAESIVRSRSAS